jgi:hypothetical protein
MRLIVLSCLFLLLLPAHAGYGQQQDLITGKFSGSFESIAQQIEATTSYRFYYKPEWVDTLTFNTEVTSLPVTEVLSKLFTGTQLRYAIDARNNIYITHDRAILTELPAGFFPDEDKNKGEKKPAFFDYSEYEKREKKKKTAEEKVYYVGNDTGNMQGNATVAGNVIDTDTGEPIIGASVYIQNPLIGATTDQFGYYSLTIPKRGHEIHQAAGYALRQRQARYRARRRHNPAQRSNRGV